MVGTTLSLEVEKVDRWPCSSAMPRVFFSEFMGPGWMQRRRGIRLRSLPGRRRTELRRYWLAPRIMRIHRPKGRACLDMIQAPAKLRKLFPAFLKASALWRWVTWMVTATWTCFLAHEWWRGGTRKR